MANRNIEHAVRVALFAASAASIGGFSSAALAQDQEVEQIVVTGSRIPQPNIEGSSPVSVISSADVAIQGVQKVENLINNLPQVFAGQGGNYSNGASGTATVNLRGLGSARTMVLINGRRMVAGSPRGPEAPDLNQIPSPLIDRVEVLTGGASAVYGSDAVAGVVNFIMKDNFEGIQFDANTSFYNHENNNPVEKIVVASGYEKAPNYIGADGGTTQLSLLMGSNFADGKGNATVFLGWQQTDALLQSERDYSGCALGSHPSSYNGEQWYCGGSSAGYPGRFRPYWPRFRANGSAVADPSFSPTAGGNPGAWSGPYNFGPLNFWQRPDERWTASAFMHYDISDSAQLYSEFMFHDDRTKSQIAPSGIFAYSTYGIPCDGSNPLVSAAWLNVLCINRGNTIDPETGLSVPVAPLSPEDTASIRIARRNVEGGGRQDDIRHTSYRGVVGAKGSVWDNWNYDVSATYSTVVFSQVYQNDFSITRTARAMDVIRDPATGQAVCRSVVDGTDPNCVPYNIWSSAGVTPQALNYLQIPLFSKGDTSLKTVTATMAADLGNYGVKIPLAHDGVGVSFGADYVENALDFLTDPNFASGDGAGQGGPTIGQSGGYNVRELFGEVRVPIIQDMFMADSLILNGSYRRSDYSKPIDESTDTYGVGLEWAPIKDIMFRGSYQQAIRAPSIIELFAAQSLGLYDNDADPCSGAPDPVTGIVSGGATAAQCANTGVTPTQYGGIENNEAGQYNAIFGGSQSLVPETATSYTVGFVLQPRFLEGFSLTLDYFNIEVEDVISTIPPTVTLNQCLASGNPAFCDKIHRDSRGSLWQTPQAFIESVNLNIGALKTSGYDIDIGYTTEIGDWGSLVFRFNGTMLDELITQPIAGAGSVGQYDCVGLYGSDCGTPNPEWRHTARITWSTPWSVDLSMAWRHFDEVLIDNTSKNPLIGGDYNVVDRKLAAQEYLDVAATWTLLENYTVRFGINNVTDQDPPLSAQVGSGAGNGNTYPQVYDALGRYVFMGLTAKF